MGAVGLIAAALVSHLMQRPAPEGTGDGEGASGTDPVAWAPPAVVPAPAPPPTSAPPAAPTAPVTSAPPTSPPSVSAPTSAASAGRAPAGVGSGWAVQVGVFANRTNALALRDRLAALDFRAFVAPMKSDEGKELTRVLIGPEAERAAADSTRRSLLEGDAPQEGFLVPYPASDE